MLAPAQKTNHKLNKKAVTELKTSYPSRNIMKKETENKKKRNWLKIIVMELFEFLLSWK